MSISWSSEYSIGVANIDEQHKELFGRIDLLLSAMQQGKGKSEVLKSLQFLSEYVIKHFSEEETIMLENNYPQYKVQHGEHEKFKKEIEELKNKFETKGASAVLTIQLNKSLIEWCKNHIMTLDKELGIYINSKR